MQPANPDIIYLHGLTVDCIIGVWEWERRFRQRVTIDLDLAFDIRAAARSDALEQTLSYRDVAKRVQAFAREAEFALVEKLAEEIAALLLGEFHLRWCRVKINKFGAVRGAGDVGVVIERGDAAESQSQ
ncbi:MAG: dihydroneopterin aldolase [Gammaproteobacteria bacterium]